MHAKKVSWKAKSLLKMNLSNQKFHNSLVSSLNQVDSEMCDMYNYDYTGRKFRSIYIYIYLVMYMTSIIFWIYKESCDENQIPKDTIPMVARAWTSSNMTFCCCSGTFCQSVLLQALKIRHRLIINIKNKSKNLINKNSHKHTHTQGHSTSAACST